MTSPGDLLRSDGPVFHRASGELAIGKAAGLKAEAQITSGGLLAVGGLVAMILLSTAVLVRSATRPRRIAPAE